MHAAELAPPITLREELASYRALFVRALKASFAYREAVWTWMLAAGISYSVPLFVWRHVYAHNPQSPAVPAADIFPYLLLAACLNYGLGMNVEGRVGQRIRMGLIATDLLKPIDFQIAQIAQAVADGLFNLTLTLPIYAVAYLFLGPALLPSTVVAFVASCVSAALSFLILFGVSFLLVQAAFYTYSSYGIFVTRQALQLTFSGLSAPLILYPDWLRNAAEWLPFRHTIHTPIAIYLGWVRGTEVLSLLAQQCVWAVALFVVGKIVLKGSLKRLEIQGG